MTKKHFIAFAREIANSSQSEETRWAMARLIIRVADWDNGRFDRVLFLTACGLSELSPRSATN